MFGAILPIVGAAGGFMIGGLSGLIKGAVLGSAVNSFFGSKKKQTVTLQDREGARLSDLRVQLSSYGEVIPKVYGTIRLAGNIIWATDIREVSSKYSEYGVSSGVTTIQNNINYSYSVSLAIALCEGEVDEIIRIWADSKLLDSGFLGADKGKFNIYLGSRDQLPDNIIGKYKPSGTYPAYRGLCYVVIDDFPLAEFAGRIPNFTFEVRRSVKFKPTVEEKIKEVVLIPGAGEFIYSDKVHNKHIGLNVNDNFYGLNKTCLNMHNYSSKANMLVAIDQMAKTLPNLEYVALVVTWFGTSINASNCRIIPKVEYPAQNVQVSPTDWQVAGITRANAEVVLHFNESTPTYGGTPSDDTVIAICHTLKERGYKIMLYPMIFVDVIEPDPKPWRGRITSGSSEDIDGWFNAPNGYNDFIMHYANLTSDFIDAFIIGSEMVGLTAFTDKEGSYPAVDQFIMLARMVKRRLGDNILITYAADWSEYHHSRGGWFNLDPLWASPFIDFVGIDAYFPLTEDLPQSQITQRSIKHGWESGEGWDYYLDWMREEKHYFADESPDDPHKYAWKNLEYWWSNVHHNPNGVVTEWQPRMKPVWFTEFGFPSVDGAANQPNVFYDPSSSESYFPRGSKGKVNFLAQREALNATLDYLAQRNDKEGCEQLIPKRFVWTYDARPFPFWPDLKNIWQDGILWPTGHWINGKLGISTLGSIVAEILMTVGLKHTDYDVSRLTDDVMGYVISQHITAREAIQQLQSAYFFDSVESDGMLKFIPKLHSNKLPIETIPESDLIPTGNKDLKDTLEIAITQELELPQKVSVTHIDQLQNYDLVTIEAQRQVVQTKEQINFSLPIVLNSQSAKQIADITLYNAWQERNNYKLTLPPKYAYLEPTDVIYVKCREFTHQMRIVKTDSERSGQMKITAISFNQAAYEFHSETNYLLPNYEVPKQVASTIMELIDAPPFPNDYNQNQVTIKIAVVPDSDNWQGAAIYTSINKTDEHDELHDYKLLATTNSQTIMGIVLNKLETGSSLIFDNHNEIIVQLLNQLNLKNSNLTLNSTTELALLNGANLALIGNNINGYELLQFQNAELIGDNKYRLTKLLRARQGTEYSIDTHNIGDRFILVNQNLLTININNNLIGQSILYKAVSIGKSLAETDNIPFTCNARNLKPFAPVHVNTVKDENNDIIINWIRRSRFNHEWRDNVDVPLEEESEKYQIDIKQNNRLIRTLEATTQTAIYTSEQQAFDRIELPADITATIYQISAQIGKGYGASIDISL